MPVNGKVECLSWLLGFRKITPAFEKLTLWSQKWRFGSDVFPFLMGKFHGIHVTCRGRYWKMQVETVESMKVRIGSFTKFNRLLIYSYRGADPIMPNYATKKGPRPETDSEWNTGCLIFRDPYFMEYHPPIYPKPSFRCSNLHKMLGKKFQKHSQIVVFPWWFTMGRIRKIKITSNKSKFKCGQKPQAAGEWGLASYILAWNHISPSQIPLQHLSAWRLMSLHQSISLSSS